MPIMTERYSNPRWGFLDGLGAVPPTDQFAGWPSLEAKRAAQEELKKSIRAADAAIYGAARNAPGIWEKLKGFVISPLTSFLSAENRDRVAEAIDSRVAQWELFKNTLWEAANQGTITADGVTRSLSPDEAKRLLTLISRQITLMQDAVGLSNSVTVGALLQTAAKGNVEGIIEKFNKAAETLKAALDALLAILKGLSDAARKGGEWLEYLPYIVVAAIVLPFAFRAFSSYKKGGVTAAADYAAGAIETGRGRAWEGTKSAGRGAVKAAALLGSPTRRRRK